MMRANIMEFIKLEEDEELNFFVENMAQDNTTEIFHINNVDRLIYFHRFVRELHEGSYSYLEAIVEFGKMHDLDADMCAKLISADLKNDIYNEAVANRMIKSENIIANIGL